MQYTLYSDSQSDSGHDSGRDTEPDADRPTDEDAPGGEGDGAASAASAASTAGPRPFAPAEDPPERRPRDPDSILAGLNESQQEAARTTDGPVLIIAGPGSGKTRTLTHRIAYLLETQKARPWEVLAITFTNKAAREMRQRVLDLVGHEIGRGMTLGTFHATFAKLMRVEGERIGYTSDFSIYDTDDSERIIRDLMHRFNIDTQQVRPRAIRHIISGAKNKMIDPAEFSRNAVTAAQLHAAELYEPYERELRQANALDFDDLLLKPIQLFRQHKDVLEKYQRRWKYIHIDEYQDTNRAQYLLAKMLADGHKNLCVVGDDAQSIYAFRGADITNILSFQNDYPDAVTVRLEQNYRSTKHIIRLADSIIRNNTQQLEKELWTENPKGDPVTVLESISEKDEAHKVERRIRDVELRLGLMHKDFAVLYRTNAQSRSIEDALRRGGIPYRVVGGVSFYQRKEIKDAIAYLRLLVNPNDAASLKRVINNPTRGIGNKTQDRLFAFAERERIGAWDAVQRAHKAGLGTRAENAIDGFRKLIDKHRTRQGADAADDIAKDLIRESGLLEDLRKEHTPENLVRWENVQELLNAISEFAEAEGGGGFPGQVMPDVAPDAEPANGPGSLSAFLQEVSLLTDADQSDDSENRVTLMSLHASKGLEFPVVFLTGMEENLFPLQRAAQDPEELEEERRLFYVGVTRAERLLFLSHARSRYRYGEQQPGVRSRFLEEVDSDVLRTETGQPFDPDEDRFTASSGSRSSRTSYESMDPYYYRKNLRDENGAGGSAGSGGKKRVIKRSTGTSKPADTGRRVVYDAEESQELAPGMRVEHHLFGEGKVIAMEGQGQQAKATVFFEEVGQKKLILRFARLQRIG
ncbi:MAG: UvrD-helicase domain-containing protein [Rhodothermales bacterium]|nr:UvrD-helicase domain-containing protein [Rhodothermales bacterium]